MKIDIKNKVITHKNQTRTYDDIMEILSPLDEDVVYMAGSIIEGAVSKSSVGMGNELSDIDIFIIRQHKDFVKTKATYVTTIKKVFFLEGILNGLDIEVYDYDYIKQLTDVVNEYKAKANKRIGNTFAEKMDEGNSITEISTFFSRLKHSICLHNIETYHDLIGKINFDNFFQISISHYITKLDNMYPDIYGNLWAKQYDVSLYCVREAYLNVMRIILLSEEILVDRVKWIPIKFKNMVYSKKRYLEIWQTYVDLTRGDLTDDTLCDEMIRKALRQSKQVVEEILLGGISL